MPCDGIRLLQASVLGPGITGDSDAAGEGLARATFRWFTVLLRDVELVVSDPLDELSTPDVISSGGEGFGAFAEARWRGLVRLAFGLTGDRRAAEDIAQATLARAYVAWRRVSRTDDPDAYLRRVLVKTSNRRFRRHRAAEQSGDPPETAVEGSTGLPQVIEPPAPVDSIIRRGKGIRLRRAVAAVGCLSLGGIIAAATVLAPPPTLAPQESTLSVTVPASGTAGPGGVFASGTVNGHSWRLAVQDIADPGYRCIPAITINGTYADPVYPAPENGADVAIGPAEPGVGFAFVQLPADVEGLVLDGKERLPATTATVCGQHYRVVGFAYRLTHQPQITAVRARPGWPKLRMSGDNDAQDLPAVTQLPLTSTATAPMSQTDGMWNNVGTTGAETASGILASGQDWSIRLLFGPGGDCYEFSASSPNNPDIGACGPISTPDGPETIMALPLSYPLGADNGATGYALQVSPVTTHLQATLSDGSTRLVTPQVVGGRRYAAFTVGRSLRLTRLTWINAAGKEIASTAALPRYGYTQFQP